MCVELLLLGVVMLHHEIRLCAAEVFSLCQNVLHCLCAHYVACHVARIDVISDRPLIKSEFEF